MNITVEPITTDSVVKVFKAVLNSLDLGPRCLHSLALLLVTCPTRLYPYLAEMLAREWIVVRSDEEVGRLGRRSTTVPDGLLRARNEHKRLAGLGDPERIIGRTKVWFNFFHSLEELPFDRRPLVHLSMTELGKQFLYA